MCLHVISGNFLLRPFISTNIIANGLPSLSLFSPPPTSLECFVIVRQRKMFSFVIAIIILIIKVNCSENGYQKKTFMVIGHHTYSLFFRFCREPSISCSPACDFSSCSSKINFRKKVYIDVNVATCFSHGNFSLSFCLFLSIAQVTRELASLMCGDNICK